MIASSFKSLLLAALLLLPEVAFAQQPQQLPVAPGARVNSSIDHAIRQHHTRNVYYVYGLEPLDVRNYRDRMTQILEYVVEQEKKLKDNYFHEVERYRTLGRYMQEEDVRIKEKEARLKVLAEGKGRRGSDEMRIIAEYLPQMSKRFTEHLQERDRLAPRVKEYEQKQAELEGMRLAIEPLAKPPMEEAGAPVSRPTVERIEINTAQEKLFEAQLSLDPAAIDAMRQSIEDYKSNLMEFETELSSLRPHHARVVQNRAQVLADSDAAMERFKEKHRALDESISSELWSRALMNAALDIVEVVIQSKLNVGLVVFELGGKVAEAVLFNDYGKKNWQMYDPSLLVGDYQTYNTSTEAHWNDQYATSKPYLDQGKRVLLAATLEMIQNEPARRAAMREFSQQLREATIKRAVNASRNELLQRIYDIEMKILVKQQIAWFGKRAAMTGAERTAQVAAQRAAAQSLAALRTELRATANVVEEAAKVIAKSQAGLKNFSIRNFLRDPKKVKDLGKSLGIGLSFDIVRQGWQHVMDSYSEEKWTEFLEAEVAVKGMLHNLKIANESWLSVSNSIALYESLKELYEMMISETARAIQEYSSARLGEDGMNVISRRVTDDATIKPTLKLHTRGEIRYLAVTLKGNRGEIEFKPTTPMNGYKSLTLDIVKEEIAAVQEGKDWEFTLEPGRKKLSDITSNGKLTVLVRFY